MVFFSSPILILALHWRSNNASFFFYGIRVNFREPSSIFDESLWNSLRIPTTPSLCVSLMRRTYMRIRSILINTFFETHAQSMRERLPWPLRGHQPNPNRVFFSRKCFRESRNRCGFCCPPRVYPSQSFILRSVDVVDGGAAGNRSGRRRNRNARPEKMNEQPIEPAPFIRITM